MQNGLVPHPRVVDKNSGGISQKQGAQPIPSPPAQASSARKISPFNISYNKDLVMMNSFNFTLSGKHFICPSILSDSFAGQSNLGCRSLPFMILNTFSQPLIACKVSFEKSADSLMGTPLYITVSFSLAAFKILYLSLILGNVIMMCLRMCFLGHNIFGSHIKHLSILQNCSHF